MRQKHGPVALEAIVMPVLQEVGRRPPIRSGRPEHVWQPGEDPLTAGLPPMAPAALWRGHGPDRGPLPAKINPYGHGGAAIDRKKMPSARPIQPVSWSMVVRRVQASSSGSSVAVPGCQRRPIFSRICGRADMFCT